MPWTTAVYNRNSSSYYDYTDLGRVKNNIAYLRTELINKLYIPTFTVSTGVNATASTIPRVEYFVGYANDINLLWSKVDNFNNLYQRTNYTGDDPTFKYTEANSWEQALDLLNTTIININTGYRQTGLANYWCGTDHTL